ncbi:MAG TPA: terminase family protein [Verrucomicrobiae bacterium]|nr:terminase family protein [Verrucomicrobiae bacterium]
MSFGFLPYQSRWINDHSRLKIIEKSRQIGITYADAFDSVKKAASKTSGNHVWVSSRDELTSRLYLDHCKRWAQILHQAAEDLGQVVIDPGKDIKAHALRFASGWTIHCVSSNPDALVGKTGHIKLDEFAVSKAQRELFRYAKPCTTWGGQLAIISTHRGIDTVFNEMLVAIKQKGNPMGFSHHRVTIHDAVEQGLVEKINQVRGVGSSRCDDRGATESREQFLSRLRAECLDEESWLQEYCCIPADENAAFITYEMIHSCESPGCLRPFSYLVSGSASVPVAPDSVPPSDSRAFYVGVDVARKHHLTVIDVGEKVADVHWDRMRIELQDKTFSEIEHELFQILELRQIKRCCIDATGLGMQLAERAKERFGWKVEGITFNPTIKEEMAFALRTAFEDRTLRIDPDPKLRSDLRGIKKVVTSAGKIRFVAEEESGAHANGHCDRFWAKALRHHAATQKQSNIGAVVIDDGWDTRWSGGFTNTAGIISGLSQLCR